MRFRLVTITLAVTLSLLATNIHSSNAQAPVQDLKLIHVFGEVNSPGVYLVKPDLTLKKLVVVVGGMTGEAGAKFSLILREPPNGGRRQRVKVDLNALVEGTTPDIPLKDDDIIIVPRDKTPKPKETK